MPRHQTRSYRTAASFSRKSPIAVATPRDWRTTDDDEIQRRQKRAREERFIIRNTDARQPVFSTFRVQSGSGMTYFVEVRDVKQRQFSCTCGDFRHNELGTCKHIEAVLLQAQAQSPRLFARAIREGSGRIDVVCNPERSTLLVERGLARLPAPLRRLFDRDGLLLRNVEPEEAAAILARRADGAVRISQDVAPWLQSRAWKRERIELRRQYESRVHSGQYPAHETKLPLYPYQREGMLHLAFNERALLADEMGLGKTIQAVAACSLLHRLGKARRVLVVSPASLKTEWEEQIVKFTDLPYRVVYGGRRARLDAYASAPFFTLVNYEQMRSDALDVNARLQPDIVVLDEAQRIKNWNTSTAQAVKRLRSRYSFVLTGTPIENRIDEIYSIIDFLDPTVFGPLFRFNREYYELDERGRPAEYRNLQELRERVRPIMLRRRKADVETELPGRSDRNYFVSMSDEQWGTYREHEANVARLLAAAKKRPLTKQEQDKLMRELAMMRMVCDTNYILDPDDRVCPKLNELENILDETLSEPDVKIVLFSEWVRMLELVKELCERKKIGYAWHTGEVPQRRRRAEILLFKSDPACRVFICSESGGVGLNLQNASVVVNCDLPWNPARLEQRIARVWRKHQTRSVSVVNLISENTIEHRMLETLAAKQSLADGVLDAKGDLKAISLRRGAEAFFTRLEQVMAPVAELAAAKAEMLPVDRTLALARRVKDKINGRLLRTEEMFPLEGAHSVVLFVVDRDADELRETLRPEFDELLGPGRIDPLAPVRFDVIDRATHEALKRLQEQGVVKGSTRAVRTLYPESADGKELSDEQKRAIAERRQKAARKLQVARLLLSGGLPEEARAPALGALEALAAAVAEEQRLPPPRAASDVCLSPWSNFWREARAAGLADFISVDNAPPGAALIEALAAQAGAP